MNYHFKTYFLMLAHYNQWANNKLFAVLEALPETQLNQDCGAYFNSLIQTANHVFLRSCHHVWTLSLAIPAARTNMLVLMSSIKSIGTKNGEWKDHMIN